MTSKNYKISFAVPSTLKKELRARVIKDDYGLRGKSKWICEAVEHLLELKTFFDLITISEEMSGFDEMETAVIDYQLKMKIDKASLEIRKKFPMFEGITSRIMRTAILQRLIRS